MGGNRRKIATKPYNYVTAEQLEERVVKYDQEVAKAFRERFEAHDEQIRGDVDEILEQEAERSARSLRAFEVRLRDRLMATAYVQFGGTAVAVAIAIVALVLAVS